MAVQPTPIEIVSEIDKYKTYEEKQFITTAEVTIPTSSETPVFLIKNTSINEKYLKIKSIGLSNIHTVSSFVKVRFYKNPTITVNGVPANISSTHIGSLAVSDMQSFILPTISSNGVKIGTWSCPGGINSKTVKPELYSDLLLDPNQSILITGQADGTNRILALNFLWVEI